MSTVGRWAAVLTSVAGTAGLGSLASASDAGSLWYRRLSKPPFQPPAVAFPVVWTLLYADIATPAALTLDQLGEPERASYVRALGANLVLNAGWSWVFFRWHRLGPSVVVAAAIWRRNPSRSP